MSQHPQPTAAIRAVPATTPFVAPEELARRVGRSSLVRLGANESAFGPSPLAIAAMQAAVPMVSIYGDPESVDLRTALAARHNCTIENIVVGSGVDELLGLICRTYGALGDPVLMSHGSYATFAFQVIGHGLDLITVPPFSDGGIDVEAMHPTPEQVGHGQVSDQVEGDVGDVRAQPEEVVQTQVQEDGDGRPVLVVREEEIE